jgi:hypothetical protein
MPIWIVASDLVEARLDHAVVARLDPLAPDPFVFYERLTVDRVAEECPAIGRFDLEPVLRTCACERENWPPSGCRRARRAWLETIKTMITITSSADR